MSKLAIFIDGGYAAKIAENNLHIRIDYENLSNSIHDVISNASANPLDLLRTYFYDCLPYQSNQPTTEEARRFSRKRSFFSMLERLPDYCVREGRLKYRGNDSDGAPIFQQKRVDLMIGLDVASLAAKNAISHAAIFTGDSDLLPAFEAVKSEGISVWLVHGPPPTYADELWRSADNRLSVADAAFINRVRRNR